MIATALTFFKNFSVPCLYVALAGFGLGNCSGWKAGRMYSEHEIHDAQQAQAKAEKNLSDFKTSIDDAMKKAQTDQLGIQANVREDYGNILNGVSALSVTLGSMRRDVRLCASTSNLPVPVPAEGAGEAPVSGEPRAAEIVLQELAARFAEVADRNAAQCNALTDWLEKTAAATGIK